jgi:hypothetical protein
MMVPCPSTPSSYTLQTFLITKLTPAKNVSHVKSALSIRTSKLKPGMPIRIDGVE